MTPNKKEELIEAYTTLFAQTSPEKIGKAMGELQMFNALRDNEKARGTLDIGDKHLGTLYLMSPLDLCEQIDIMVTSAIKALRPKPRIKLTCDHHASRLGIPVFLDENDYLLSDREGLTKSLEYLGWKRADFAQSCGYATERSVDKFWQKTTPPAGILNLLELALSRK